jgi:hypothetical protein
MPPAASRFEIGLLYAAGVVQGLALVTFPAASAIFVSATGFGWKTACKTFQIPGVNSGQ